MLDSFAKLELVVRSHELLNFWEYKDIITVDGLFLGTVVSIISLSRTSLLTRNVSELSMESNEMISEGSGFRFRNRVGTSLSNQVNGLELCFLAKDYKKRTKANISDADFYNQELKDLKQAAVKLGGTLPKRSTKSGLVKIIMKLVAEKCPDQCLSA